MLKDLSKLEKMLEPIVMSRVAEWVHGLTRETKINKELKMLVFDCFESDNITLDQIDETWDNMFRILRDQQWSKKLKSQGIQ